MTDKTTIYSEMEYSSRNVLKLLAEGVYRNVKWYVMSLGTHPCGYVDIEGKVVCDSDIECNGGITYHGNALNIGKEVLDGFFIGWDYAHCWDYMGYYNESDTGQRHTTEEIIEDCKSVINQILKLGE